MVKPGGTGRPAAVMSARPCPLPPRISLAAASVGAALMPSALPAPKKKTRLAIVDEEDFEADFTLVLVATGGVLRQNRPRE